jgi:general secretion pathway protein C
MHSFGLRSRYDSLLKFGNFLIFLAIVIVCLVVIRDILKITHKRRDVPVVTSLDKTGAPKARKLEDYEIILRNNPFGFDAGTLKPLTHSGEKAAAISDMTLIGTVTGPEVYSFAIFMAGKGTQEVYRVGESIPGVGKLKRVETDKVFIGGRERMIEVPIADIVTITDVTPAQKTPGGSSFARSIGQGSYIVDQKKVEQAIEHPNQLMTDARLQPNITDGKQEGYVLREVRPGGIYQSLGLQNGDVLLRINEYNISNPENALQAFTALRGMERVQLDILRNNAKMTMTYQIR